MKELTIEEKAKAYDEALKNARYYHSEMEGDVCCVLEECFPELKNSEDERIREALIKYLDTLNDNEIRYGVSFKDMHTWLEKQCEPIDREKVLICARRDIALSIMNFLDRNTFSICLSNMECADLESAVVDSDWSKVYDYMKKKLEKQSEQKEFTPKSAIETIKEEKVDNANKIELKDYNSIDHHFCKLVDKIEPKFHEGDWIISHYDHVAYIKSIDEKYYSLSCNDGNSEKLSIDCINRNWRLWTIQDAKDGDVLATKKGNPFIYDKNRYNNGLSYYYAGLDVHKELTLKNPHNMLAHFGELHSVSPATKEQRDILFIKIKEAGYKWDVEKKELKKIGQNFTDFEVCLKHIMEEAIECGDTHNLKADAEMLLKVAHKHAEWSEEDEEMIEGLNNCLDELEKESGWCYVYVNNKNVKLNKVRNWLKFVKERVQIQPMKGE